MIESEFRKPLYQVNRKVNHKFGTKPGKLGYAQYFEEGEKREYGLS